MIIRGGENIYPKEIEAAIYENPDVFEAAVVARPHDVFGEVPLAYVALNEGATTTPESLLEEPDRQGSVGSRRPSRSWCSRRSRRTRSARSTSRPCAGCRRPRADPAPVPRGVGPGSDNAVHGVDAAGGVQWGGRLGAVRSRTRRRSPGGVGRRPGGA
ncbi:hypothetical protein [Nocardioides convexus]|uniref:AMP-binding enzyme n=1 Tax=Nocardioides convexus TaxID=2712224 RepID=UPI0024187364|nr:hypothetical protein [Nocardioides convexus]